MKKVTLAIAMAALVLLAGCKKDKETTGTTLKASIEQQSGNGSRTSIHPVADDQAEIHWTDGDKIVVNNGTSSQVFNLTAGAGGKTGTFTYNGEYTFGDNNIAVYPETATISGNEITVTLPAEKTVVPDISQSPMMGTFSDPDDLTFTSLCGVLGIGLKGDNINITAVEIVSNANEKLNGTFSCTTSNPQISVADATDEASKKMRLNCTTTLTAEAKRFYFPLPVGALAQGFTLNVYDEDNELIFTKSPANPISIELKKLNQMEELPVTIGPRSFTVDFNNDILPEGWTTIDADGDGHNWVLDTECESAYGYNQSNAGFNGGHMILSGSYHKTDGALHPDNYLVSPKVTLRSGSTFSFWAGAQDYNYPAEHFGVCVSDNGTSDWTMVQEWTMEAKGASGDKGFGRDGNTRDQGRWYYFSVDLSAYAGQRYIAIRHFNCTDKFFLNVDNIRLGDPEPGTSFSQNFNNSVLPEGWTTIDADGDGYNWVLTTQMAVYGYSNNNDGHYGTVGMTSGSYHGSAGALTPDNYLVTPKVNLVQGSTFSFWACAQDADYPAEHFGVYVSDNGTSGWTMVQEWTMTAKGASGNKGIGRDGNTRGDIGNWYQYTVDLSAYAGEKYIAIRHFNCSDEFFLNVDDILLSVNR